MSRSSMAGWRISLALRGGSARTCRACALWALAFPAAQITYKIDAKRQGVVDSWPADVDDSAARADWGFRPEYDFDRAFHQCLIPTISTYYRS